MFEYAKKLFYAFEAWGLNRNIARESSKADEIVAALALQPGDNVADIGSGSGYFVFEFARVVGEQGKVYAVDTNQNLLGIVAKRANSLGLRNIVTLKTDLIPDLPQGSIDLIFNRATYHHLSDQVNYFRSLKMALSERGRVGIIDYDRAKISFFHKLSSHQASRSKIISEMEAAGYVLSEEFHFLPEQNFLIFASKK